MNPSNKKAKSPKMYISWPPPKAIRICTDYRRGVKRLKKLYRLTGKRNETFKSFMINLSQSAHELNTIALDWCYGKKILY